MENCSIQNPPYKLVIDIADLPKSPNAYGTAGNKWAVAKDRKHWRDAVSLIARTRRPPAPLTKVSIICTRYSSRAMDFDNRVMSFKPLIDGLVDGKIIVDDKDSVIVDRKYPQVISKARGIKIEVIELRDADLNRCLFCGK